MFTVGHLVQWLSNKMIVPLGGHLTMAGDILGWYNLEVGETTVTVWSPRMLLNVLEHTGQPPVPQRHPAQHISSSAKKPREDSPLRHKKRSLGRTNCQIFVMNYDSSQPHPHLPSRHPGLARAPNWVVKRTSPPRSFEREVHTLWLSHLSVNPVPSSLECLLGRCPLTKW